MILMHSMSRQNAAIDNNYHLHWKSKHYMELFNSKILIMNFYYIITLNYQGEGAGKVHQACVSFQKEQRRGNTQQGPCNNCNKLI
jgi:hypothetical protein